MDNIGSIFADGARVFVGGGAIAGQQDMRSAVSEFRNSVLMSKRQILLEQANQLGGNNLVNRWIDLHVVGEKHEYIKKLQKRPDTFE